MFRTSEQLSRRKKRRRLRFEPLECRQLLSVTPLPLPTPNIAPLPALQPTVITAGGQRLLLNYFNNTYNAANDPAAEVQVSFDTATDTLVSNKPGWWVENYPLTQINGLQGLTANQIAGLLFGDTNAADVKNWYVYTPVDATHPAPAEPAAPTGPAPITPTNLAAQAGDGSYFHILVVDNNPSVTSPTSDPYVGSRVQAAETATSNQVVVDATVYRTITAAVDAITASPYYASATGTVTRPTIILITPGSGDYEENIDMHGSALSGTSLYPMVLEGVPDANGNLPVWINAASFVNGWTQVGTSPVWKSTFNPYTWLGNVVEHTNSDVDGDLTPGTGNQQTLIESSLPNDLQEGQFTYQFSSDEFENNLHGMLSDAGFAQMPDAGLPSDAAWIPVDTTAVAGDPGYLDFGSTGAGSAADCVYWASTWVWVPPGSSDWNWQDPATLSEATGNYTYGPFRISQNPSQDCSDQYNKDRIWVNGQMIPAAIFSTASDNESLDPHSYPWYGDNACYSSTATDEIECLNLQQGWNHLVFQFDTSSTASAENMFQNEELAFKFGLNAGFFDGGTGLISSATAPANLSQAPTTGTPEPYISQYSVLSTSATSIATPLTNETFDPAVYVRLRNGEAPAGASMAMASGALNSGAFIQVRGLDFLEGGVGADRQGDLVEGCIASGLNGQNGWCQSSYAVYAPNTAGEAGQGIVGYVVNGQVVDTDALDFSAMGWTNNMVVEPDYQITNGTAVSFSSSSQLPPSVAGNEYPYNGGYYSQVYYLGLTGTAGVYDVFSDPSCAAQYKVAISSGWTSAYSNVTINIGLGTNAMTPITYLDNWVVNDTTTGSSMNLPPADLVTAASENGNAAAAGEMQYIVENNMFLNSDTEGSPLGWEDGGTKTFRNDGCVLCYNTYDGGSDQALWFDTEHWDNRVEGNLFENFAGGMVSFEASPGPNLVADNIFTGMLGYAGPGGEAAISNNSSNQTWAVNNTIDSQSPSLGLTGIALGNPSQRYNRWEWPSPSQYDTTGGYSNDATDAYVNNVVLGCQTAVAADLPDLDPSGYPFLPDTVAGNYTDNPGDPYLGSQYGAQTQYPGGVQLMSLDDMGFVNEAAGDYQLTAGSPLNDAGVTSALYSNGPQGNPYTTTYQYNVAALATQDFYGLLRDIPGDPQSAGATRPAMTFTSTDIEWENAAGAQARVTDYFPSGPVGPPIVTVKATTPAASDSGPADGVFTVTREGPTTAALTVHYTLGGTARNGADYTTLALSMTIPVNSATATIAVAPLDDGVPTGAETVVLTLSSSANYTLGGQAADTVTIAPHDPSTVSIAGSGTLSESGPAGGFTVTRTGNTSQALVVDYATSGTAVNGADYQTLSGQLTIQAGSATATITLTPIEDLLIDGTETAMLTIAQDPNNLYVPASAPNNQASMGIADTADESGLLADWQLDETGGTTVHDSSANALNGTFQTAPASYSTGAGTHPGSVIAADLAGNGITDLVTANSSANTVSVLMGNGNGTFQSPVTYAVGTDPTAVTVGDFNGDGKLDLAVANYGSNSVSVLLGNGDGTFQSAVSYNVGSEPSAIVAAVLSRPLTPSSGTLSGLVDSNDTAVPGMSIQFAASGCWSNPVDSPTTNTLKLLSGGLENGSIQISDIPYASYDVYVYVSGWDNSRAGAMELSQNASGYTGGSQVGFTAFQNASQSSLTTLTAATPSSGQPQVTDVEFAAVSGSGLTLDWNGSVANLAVMVSAIQIVDTATPQAGISVQWAENSTDAVTSGAAGAAPLSNWNYWNYSAPASQKITDLVTANYGANTVSVLVGNGNGTFQAKTDYTVGAGPKSVAIGDFNDDGNLDLATANYNANSVSVLLGNGDGSFNTKTDYAVGSDPTSIAVGDFNNDGNLDLATANYNANSVSVLLGNGGGTFQAKTDYAVGSGPTSVVAGNFDDEGNLDLATANSGAGTVSVLLGNGGGTFQAKTDYTVGAGPSAMTAADLYGQGSLELVTANSVANSVSVVAVQPWSSGRLNGAMTLDSANSQCVSVPSTDSNFGDFNFGTGPFTLSAWVKPAGFTAAGADYTILARGQNTANYFEFGLSYGANNGVFLTVGSGGTSETLAPSSDQSALLGNGDWHLVTVTRDSSGDGCLYIDGELAGSLLSVMGLNVSPVDARNLGIGACLDQGANTKYFNGKLDEVRVYDTAFTAGEVALLAGITISPPTLSPPLGVNMQWTANSSNSIPTGAAALIGSGTAGVVPLANWNNNYLSSAFQGSATLSSLVDSNDNPVAGMSIQFSGGGPWSNPVESPTSSTLDLLSGGLENGSIQVSGIPYASYDIYVYVSGWDNTRAGYLELSRNATGYTNGSEVGFTAFQDASQSSLTTLTATTAASGQPQVTDVEFAGLSATSLTLDWYGSVQNRAVMVSAIQIVDDPIVTQQTTPASYLDGVSVVANDPVAGVQDDTPDNAFTSSASPSKSLGGYNAGDTAGQGQFTLARTGDASQALAVYYNVSGSAASGGAAYQLIDAEGNVYTGTSGQATFLAGQSTTTITVQPLAATANASDETVIVTLVPDWQYEVSAQAAADTATVTITGNHLSGDWQLDQNANDSSGSGLSGTLPNGGAWATGGVTLNGANQYVSAPQVNLGTGAFTLSAWIKLGSSVTSLDSWTNVYPIVCNGLSGLGYNGFDLCVIGNAGLWLRIGSDAGNGGPYCWTATADVRGALLNHQWHLVTATRDNFGVVRLYFDGALVGTEIGSGYSVTNTNPNSKVTIGFDSSQNQDNYFNGTIADVLVYNRALEPGEIQAMAARTYDWAAGSGTFSWGAGGNWQGGIAPGVVGDAAVLGAAVGSGTATIALDSAQTVSGLTFSPGAGGSYVLSGSGASSLQLAGAPGIPGRGSSASISVTGGNDAINAPVVLENSVIVTAAGGAGLTISGDISQSGGSQALTLSGNGSLTLSGTNGYTGGTTVNGGTLLVTKSGALPSGMALTVGAGGTVVFGSSLGAAGQASALTATVQTASVVSPSPPATFDASQGNTGITPSPEREAVPAVLKTDLAFPVPGAEVVKRALVVPPLGGMPPTTTMGTWCPTWCPGGTTGAGDASGNPGQSVASAAPVVGQVGDARHAAALEAMARSAAWTAFSGNSTWLDQPPDLLDRRHPAWATDPIANASDRVFASLGQ